MTVRGRRMGEGRPLRPAILQAVLEIASQEGFHCLTMRKIAERIRYSAPMIYEVFESKEALYGELLGDGYQLLYRHMSASAAGLGDPKKRLWALLQALRAFAWENPAYYQVMFGMVAQTRPGESYPQGEYASACLGLVGDALLQCAGSGFSLGPLKGARVLFTAAHGVIASHLSGLMADRREADEMYEHVLRGLLAGWGL
ncbi:MAG TPA: TetR/AcrR family transcriptional regulator [Symbiobacteriaceae bacterium]|nr:TetR/AcrR family transcriptional regulator [Symbiobacteriaceae bacterium]